MLTYTNSPRNFLLVTVGECESAKVLLGFFDGDLFGILQENVPLMLT